MASSMEVGFKAKLVSSAVSLLLFLIIIPAGHGDQCTVTKERCNFPFEFEGNEKQSCVKLDPESDNYHCKIHTNLGDKFSWSVCDEGCFDEELGAEPNEFGGDMRTMSIFCKSVDADCVFPFKYNGIEFHECTDLDHDRFWCATKTDDDGNMVDNFWGNCNNDICQTADPDYEGLASPESEPKVAEVVIAEDDNEDGVAAEITIQQDSPDSGLVISGAVTGLTPGMHGFHVHENADTSDKCFAAGDHFNPENVTHGDVRLGSNMTSHAGDFGNIFADESGTALIDIQIAGGQASLYEQHGDISIVGRTLVIHEKEDDLGTDPDDPESLSTGNAGRRVACGLISLKPAVSEWKLTLIVIIVLAIVILLLVILLTILICYCMRRRKNRPKKDKGLPDDGPSFPNGHPKKKPLYDELSIPFIDASPAGSPRLGRSADR